MNIILLLFNNNIIMKKRIMYLKVLLGDVQFIISKI